MPEFGGIIPMPKTIDPTSKRIKTIVKHCTQSKEFDAEINDLIKDGWHLDKVRTTNSESLIMLFALLHRYEPAEETGGAGAENETQT